MQAKNSTISAYGPISYKSLSQRINSCVVDLNVTIYLFARQYEEIQDTEFALINSLLQKKKINRIKLYFENKQMIELLLITHNVTMENLYLLMTEETSKVNINLIKRFTFTDHECHLIFNHLNKTLTKTFSFELQTFKVTNNFINYFVNELKKLSSPKLEEICLRMHKAKDLINCGIESYEVLNILSKFKRFEIDFGSIVFSANFISRTMIYTLKRISLTVKTINVDIVIKFLTKSYASEISIYFKQLKAIADILPACTFSRKHGKQNIFCYSPTSKALRSEIKVLLRNKDSLHVPKLSPSWLPLNKEEVKFLQKHGYFRNKTTFS